MTELTPIRGSLLAPMQFKGQDPSKMLSRDEVYLVRAMTCYKQGQAEPEIWAKVHDEKGQQVRSLQYLSKREFDVNWEPSSISVKCHVCGMEFPAENGYSEISVSSFHYGTPGVKHLKVCRNCCEKLLFPIRAEATA